MRKELTYTVIIDNGHYNAMRFKFIVKEAAIAFAEAALQTIVAEPDCVSVMVEIETKDVEIEDMDEIDIEEAAETLKDIDDDF